jgi:23S rRNA (guanosine2251-2'-O)-methyltransferase
MTQKSPAPRRPWSGPETPDLIHGAHSVTEALKNPKRKIIALKVTTNAAERLHEAAAARGITPEIVHPRILDHLAGPDSVHQGMVLEAKPLRAPRLDQIEKSGIVVILDQVTDPHNVGAILRSCAAFGVKALVTTARHSPEASGVLFKSASGAYEHVPMVKVTNLARALEELRSYGFRLIGLDSEAETAIGAVDRAPPVALVLGAEGKGLRQLTRQTCDVVARLDMPGAIKSLNVSNAAAICLYALTH